MRRKLAERAGQRSAPDAFFRELGLGLLAFPSATLGVLMVAAFFQVAAEESSGVVSTAIAYGVALAATAVGLLLVGWVAAFVVGPMTVGWLGIFSGQIPLEFATRERNGVRALANVVLMVVSLVLGIWLFRVGVREGEANYAVEGIFLAAAGVVLGLFPAVPRLYFARKRGRAEEVDSERVIGFIVAVALGVGLSLAVSFGIADNRAPSGPKSMRPVLWHTGCVAKESTVCALEARFTFVAERGGRHYVDKRRLCGRLFFEDEAGAKLKEVRWGTLRKEGIETYDKKEEIKTRALILKPGQRAVLRVSAAKRTKLSGTCTFKLRVRPPAKGEAKP